MESEGNDGESMPKLYIGQHESERSYAINDQILQQALDCNYDMITTPITTEYFHSSVIHILSEHLSQLDKAGSPSDVPLPLIPPFKPEDTPLGPADFTSQLLGFTSPWIDLASPDPLIAHISRQVFLQEIAYAAFCGIVNVFVQGPRLHLGGNVAQYARAIQEALATGPYLQVHLIMPMTYDPKSQSDIAADDLAKFVRLDSPISNTATAADEFGSWDAWHIVRNLCRYHSKLSIALDLPRKLPSLAIQSRWYSEPVRLLLLHARSFLTNARGSYVLSKAHQVFIARCIRLKYAPWLLLSDVGPIPGLNDPEAMFTPSTGLLSPGQVSDARTPESSMSPSPTPAEAARMPQMSRSAQNDPTPHLSYVRYLQRNQPPRTKIELFGSGYQDYLQSPLQPLTDNLESITYEVFETDPIKYAWYQRAIEQALLDWSTKSISSDTGAIVIAVVGAGRGPLVTRALQASESTGVPIELHAVEKNPNAYVVLQRHNLGQWKGAVTIVKSDMRSWKGPSRADGSHGKVDILVSELLGSFADNELSPECLDGVQHVLNPIDGISIPESYTAHLTPIAAPKLHADVMARTDPSTYETPYVVMLHAIDFLSTTNADEAEIQATSSKASRNPSSIGITTAAPDIKQAWEFSHPLPPSILKQSNLRRGGGVGGGAGGQTGGDGANEHNVRFSTTSFDCKYRGVCHGIGGYFETVLYRGSQGAVELSTNPVTMDAKSKDMISWFPIYFPLKVPMYLPDDSELEIRMWRQTDDRKVWFEWELESFKQFGSQRIRLGISELHSSKQNACLM